MLSSASLQWRPATAVHLIQNQIWSLLHACRALHTPVAQNGTSGQLLRVQLTNCWHSLPRPQPAPRVRWRVPQANWLQPAWSQAGSCIDSSAELLLAWRGEAQHPQQSPERRRPPCSRPRPSPPSPGWSSRSACRKHCIREGLQVGRHWCGYQEFVGLGHRQDSGSMTSSSITYRIRS